MENRDCPLCCDCDRCLNGNAGVKVKGAGVVRPAPKQAKAARPRGVVAVLTTPEPVWTGW